MYMVKEGTALHIALLWCLVAFLFISMYIYTICRIDMLIWAFRVTDLIRLCCLSKMLTFVNEVSLHRHWVQVPGERILPKQKQVLRDLHPTLRLNPLQLRKPTLSKHIARNAIDAMSNLVCPVPHAIIVPHHTLQSGEVLYMASHCRFAVLLEREYLPQKSETIAHPYPTDKWLRSW